MNLRGLNEQRAAHTAAMRNLLANASDDLTDAQSAEFDKMKTELSALDTKIERAAFMADLERREAGTPVTGRDFEREKRQFSFCRMIQHQLGAKVDAGREMEISAELARLEGRSTEGFFMPYSFFEKRADVITTGQPAAGPGSNMIGTDHLGGQFIDLLREANPLASLGVRSLSGLVGNVDIPKLKRSTSVGWFGENSEIPQTDAAFDKVTLSPKHVGAWTEYSRNMLLQSSPDIESFLRSDLAQVLALEVARATISGAGGTEPTGILKTAGIQKVAAPSDPMQYVPVLADKLFLANVPAVSFLTDSGYKLTVDQLLTTDGLPIGAPAFFRGYPHVFTNLVPAANTMIAGDFTDVIQGTWSGVEVLVNPYMESAYKKGNVAMRIILTMDVAVRHPESFATFGA